MSKKPTLTTTAGAPIADTEEDNWDLVGNNPPKSK